MRRMVYVFSVSFVLGVIWGAEPSEAQSPVVSQSAMRRPGTMQLGGGTMLGLLHNEKVQEDLGLADEQEAKLKELAKTLRGNSQETVSAEERRARLENARLEINRILEPEQIERLKQIHLQVVGPAALGDPEVAKALDITKEQREKLRTIRRNVRENPQGPESQQERLEQRRLARGEAEKQVLDVLTEEQRKKLEKMKGKKLDIDVATAFPR